MDLPLFALADALLAANNLLLSRAARLSRQWKIILTPRYYFFIGISNGISSPFVSGA